MNMTVLSELLPRDPALADLSPYLFKLRRNLTDQFGKLERDLLTRYRSGTAQFGGKIEFEDVVDRINSLRKEIDQLLVRTEERVQTIVDQALSKGRQTAHSRREPQEQRPGDFFSEQGEDFFQDLNLFNMRRKYHEWSLKLRSEEVDPFGYDPLFDRFCKPLFDFLHTKYWRVETYGVCNVPRTGSCLLVGNHSGTLPFDATMLKMSLVKEHPARRELRFMVEDFLFHFPFLGSLMTRFGGVRASQENAQKLLQADMSVLVFPEGTKGLGKPYRDKYHLARFGRGGFVKLCLRTRAPLVPVAFLGAEEIYPLLYKETFFSQMLGIPYLPVTPTFPWLGPLGLIPLPSKWSLHILPAIDFSEYGPGAEKDRVLVHKMSQRVKEVIQDTIVEKLKTRRSIWFG